MIKLSSFLDKSKEYWESSILISKNFPYNFSVSILLLNYAVELWLKAILLNNNNKNIRTHNLIELWNRCKNEFNELSKMQIDEYIIMLNRFNYPNTGSRYPNSVKSSEWSIDTKIFEKMTKIINFICKNIDPNKDITDLIKKNKEGEYIAYIEEICGDWTNRWIIFKDVKNFSLLGKEIYSLILEAEKTCKILNNLKVPNKLKIYNKYFYEYFNFIAKCKNENSNDRKFYFNKANENLKNSLDYIDSSNQIKKCTNFLYEESTKIR